MRYLMDSEYKERRSAFLSMHKDNISHMLLKEMDAFLDERKKDTSLQGFLQTYCGGLILVFIIVFFGAVSDVISYSTLIVVVLVEIFVIGWAYANWQDERKMVSLEIFANHTHELVQGYIWEKMLEELNSGITDDEYEMAVQFYSIAIYEIPRNESFIDVYRGKKR